MVEEPGAHVGGSDEGGEEDNTCDDLTRSLSLQPREVDLETRKEHEQEQAELGQEPQQGLPRLDQPRDRTRHDPEQDLQHDGRHAKSAGDERDDERRSGDGDHRHRCGDAVTAHIDRLGDHGAAGTTSTLVSTRWSRWPTIPGATTERR